MDILEIAKKIARDLGDLYKKLGIGFIADKLIDAYKDIYNNCNWSFYLKYEPLLIRKYLKLKVANATEEQIMYQDYIGDEIENYNGQKYYNGKDYIPYNITSVNSVNKNFTISPSQINIPTQNSYIYVYMQDYALPSDCAFNKEICIIDVAMGRSLAKMAEPTFSYMIKNNMFSIGEPIAYISKSKDYFTSDNDYLYNYIAIYPFLSSTKKYLSLAYFRKPFGNFDNVQYSTYSNYLLEVPEEFSHLLYWKGMEICYIKLGDSRAGYAMSKAKAILNDLRERNNGDEAMMRIIAEYPPYDIYIDEMPSEISVRLV
mgnify:FL=1